MDGTVRFELGDACPRLDSLCYPPSSTASAS